MQRTESTTMRIIDNSGDPKRVLIEHACLLVRNAPEDSAAWHNLACQLQQQEEIDEAVRCYRRAIECNAASDSSWNNLANCLSTQGRLEEARTAWNRAIELAPACGLYYRNLLQTHQVSADDPSFRLLEQQLGSDAGHDGGEHADLLFAYGHALTGMGERDRGFDCLSQANTLHRKHVLYDEAATLDLLDALRDIFTPELLRDKAGLGRSSDSPVFVVGMPRSGTSLVEQILASHACVYGVGERREFIHALTQAITTGLPEYPDVATLDFDALETVTGTQLAALGDTYLRRIDRIVEGGAAQYQRIVDKAPYNFMHAGFIHLALPNARIVHVRRAPTDTCLSIYSYRFEDVPFSYDLAELGRYYRAYDALMAHWRRVLPAEVFIEIDYEMLVQDFETEVRRLLEHCKLEWDARCLDFHRTERRVETASAAQVRRPLYNTSVRRWRPDAARLRPLLDALGDELIQTESTS